MANSPVLFGPNNTAINLQNQELLASGELIQNNGPANLIGFNNFQNGLTTGWSLGTTGTLTNGIPTGTPTFGSGASGNLTLSTTSTNPIKDTFSLSLASSAATTAGDMLATAALPVANEYQAKVLTFTLAYQAITNPANGNFSGTSSNSFGVACWDVTNSVWLPVAGNFSMTQTSGVGIATGTMQTNSTTASVRFMIYNANASAGAITMYFDDFYLGPNTAPIGPIVTDWIDYTVTYNGLGSVTTNKAQWRREGDSMSIRINFTTGTVTAAAARFSLPSGYSIDTNKRSGSMLYGVSTANLTNTANGHNGALVFMDSAQTANLSLCNIATGATQNNLTEMLGNATFANATANSLIATNIPIAGWSSNVQMSNDTDTRVVAARISGDPASATSGNPIIFPTVAFDTHAGYNATTGRYTVPVSGYYKVYGYIDSSNNSIVTSIYVNAVSIIAAGKTDSSTGDGEYIGMVLVNAGDLIDVRPSGTLDATAVSTLHIERVCGPSVIAATESVNCRYYASATSISGSLATINWTTKDFDSHNAMNAGTYTVPVSGKYLVTAALAMSGTFILNNTADFQLQKNGTVTSEDLRYAGGAITNFDVNVDDIISCNAGDTIRIQASSSGTGPAIVSSNSRNYIAISRVGN